MSKMVCGLLEAINCAWKRATLWNDIIVLDTFTTHIMDRGCNVI